MMPAVPSVNPDLDTRQTVIFPTLCLACKSPQLAVDFGDLVRYVCGSCIYFDDAGKIKVWRSRTCKTRAGG